MQAKYVIIKSHGNEVPIIFSKLQSHDEFRRMGCEIVSAGFVTTYEDPHDEDHPRTGEVKYSCYGQSVILDIGCRIGDDKIMKDNFERN